ncbi:MAG: hemerythrin domain-containing protein [Pseudonocardiales bacterium]|nr:hemerythrin domain-containing protein [Pseudonocardiales bacterium]
MSRPAGVDAADVEAGGVDLMMMFAIHDALRRDAARLVVAAAPATPPARLRPRWTLLAEQLHHHHTGEDTGIWPLLHPHLTDDPKARAKLEALEAQHAGIEAAVAAVEHAFTGDDLDSDLYGPLHRFAELLEQHLADEERDAIPLIRRYATARQWQAFENGQKRGLGLAGAARFFPWLLDDATPTLRARIIATLPAPLRLLVHVRWEPRYRRALGEAS